jgi:hypothetical protein
MDGQIKYVNIEKKSSATLYSGSHMIYKLFFMPENSQNFLSTHQEGKIMLWDLRNSKDAGELIFKNINPATGRVRKFPEFFFSLEFSPKSLVPYILLLLTPEVAPFLQSLQASSLG